MAGVHVSPSLREQPRTVATETPLQEPPTVSIAVPLVVRVHALAVNGPIDDGTVTVAYSDPVVLLDVTVSIELVPSGAYAVP